MSAFDEFRRLLQVADEDTIRILNVVLAHPEAAAVLSDLARLAGYTLPAGTITAGAQGLKGILGILQPAVAPAGTGPLPVDS